MKSRTPEAVAKDHKAADTACGRAWVCNCGACRMVRAAMPEARINLVLGKYWLVSLDNETVLGGPYNHHTDARRDAPRLGLRVGAEGCWSPAILQPYMDRLSKKR